MIKNGSFETDWDSSHTVRVITKDSEYTTEIGNIFTPAGDWITWFFHEPGTYDQPECRYVHKNADSTRVAEGNNAFLCFTFSRKHLAGLYQQITVEPGTKIKLNAKAHAWSNHQDAQLSDVFPHPNDPRWSEGAGYESFYALKGTVDGDALRNFTFSLGIDPTGGINPLADTVIWGIEAHIYNEHHEVPEVEATVSRDTATIFLKSETLWAFKHNDAYWDDVRVELTEEPQPEPGWGTPREQYERIYVLMPPEAMKDPVIGIISRLWDTYRVTIGGSADDAGIGALNYKHVIAIDPANWGAGLEEFFEKYYPKVQYHPVIPGNEIQFTGRLLAQIMLAKGLKLEYPTTYQPMVVTSEFGVDRSTYYHNGLDLRSSWTKYGSEVLAAIDGEVIVSGVNPAEPFFGNQVRTRTVLPDGQILLVRYAHLTIGSAYVRKGDFISAGWIVGRPDNTGNSTADHLHIDVKLGDDYIDPEILIEKPNGTVVIPPPPVPSPTSYWGLHIQSMVDGIEDYIRTKKPPITKTLVSFEDVDKIKQWNPEGIVVYRHYFGENQAPYLEHSNPYQGAKDLIATYKDSAHATINRLKGLGFSPPYFYMESLNETYPSLNRFVVRRAALFDEAFVKELYDEFGDAIGAVVFCAAVGNPHETEYDELLRVGVAAQQYNGLMGYHSYWWSSNASERGIESWWDYHAGRWMGIDRYLLDHGVIVNWYSGESGVVHSLDGEDLNPVSGWIEVYNGDFSEMLKDMNYYNDKVYSWNRDNRFKGASIFTTGDHSTNWPLFQIQADEMKGL